MTKEQESVRAEFVAAVEPFLAYAATIGEDARQVHFILAPTPTKKRTGPAILGQNTEDLLKRLVARPELAEQRERLEAAWKEFLLVFS